MVVPAATPNTDPTDVLTTATAGLLLSHVPPVEVLANVVDAPVQTVPEPVIGAGIGFTVTTKVLAHPLLTV